MIQIYNEYEHVEKVIEAGFGKKWKHDYTLLVKYYKEQGMKKSKVKELAHELVVNRIYGFREVADGPMLTRMFNKAWRDTIPLHRVDQIEIPESALNWFFELENYELDNLEYYQDRRGDLTIKDHPFNLNRIKVLFTLYVWVEIQKQYSQIPTFVSLEKGKFKQDANLATNFKLISEINFLCDLGFLHTNQNNDIWVDFTVPTDGPKIVLDGEDLYNCGMWFTNRYYKHKGETKAVKVCECCGKHFKTTALKQKYCKECGELVKNKSPKVNPKFCIDCGKEIRIEEGKRRGKYCPICRDARKKQLQHEKYLKLKEKFTLS